MLLKPDPRTAVSGGAVLAEIFAQAGLPDGLLHVLPGGADVGEALVTEPAVRVIAFTGSTRAGRAVARPGGAAPQARAPRARRQLRAARARRRRRRRGVVRRRLGLLRPSGPGVHGGGAAPGAVRRRRRLHRGAGRPGRPPPRRRPVSGQVALGPVIDAGQRDRIHAMVTGSVDAGARLAAGGTYEDLFYRPTVLADVPIHSAGLHGGGVRAGGPRGAVRQCGRRGASWRRTRPTGCRWASSPGT